MKTTTRPGPAARHAFDWLAMRLHGSDGPGAVIAPRREHALELLRRLPAVAFLPPHPDDLAGLGSTLAAPAQVLSDTDARDLRAVGLVAPPAARLRDLSWLRSALHESGRAFFVVPGLLAPLTAAARQGASRSDVAGLSAVRRSLASGGFTVSTELRVHGLAAVAWFYAGVAAATLGRDAWADRSHIRMRRHLAPARGPAVLVCLTAEVAR
jgi:hypothetical protein